MAYLEPAIRPTANQTTATPNSAGYQLGLASALRLTGITFDSGVNNLSNYVQSGTFVPTVGGESTPGTPVYTTQIGYYTRIGFLCQISLALGWSSISGAVGSLSIGGLPFVAASLGSSNLAIYTTLANSLTYGGAMTLVNSFRGGNSGATIELIGTGNGIGGGAVSPVPASGTVYISGHFLITGA